MKKSIIIISAIIFIFAIGVAVTKFTVFDLVQVDPEFKKEIITETKIHLDNPFERIALWPGKCRITSARPPFSAEAQCFTLFRIPLGVLRGQPNMKVGIFFDSTPDNEKTNQEVEKLNQAEEAIRKFAGKPELELQYMEYKNNPSNFMVGKSSILAEGAFVIAPEKEWNRPVYVFDQKEFVNSSCQVYEYEVSAETFQIIEARLIKPKWFLAGRDDCSKFGSMNEPALTEEELDQAYRAVLIRDMDHNSRIFYSSKYVWPKRNPKNPDTIEWFWEYENISLPEGLTGDPFQHPVIRVIMSSNGKLVYYLNTADLFY